MSDMSRDEKLVATVWGEILASATRAIDVEQALAPMLREFVLDQPSFSHAIAYRLGAKLVYHSKRGGHLDEVFREAFLDDPAILAQIAADLNAIVERDPACDSVLIPFLWFKGFQAITCHRVAHWLWRRGRCLFALHIQSLVSEVFAVDIHPAARIGRGILLDHATGFVVGETAIIEDDVSLLHAVTLGGTGKERGDRHPKVRRGVLIGAGAKILGNIEINEGAKIGAGSVVLDSVPPHTTVVGVPAQPVEDVDSCDLPAFNMDHHFHKLSRVWAPEI
ncbi:MAG: serine O-acetyltransferase [Puniceicoccales bacterium]|jgi:serine O-acetyltransferase|nr:serine O-acetyltransferase [Puniceicoccales bacterium]